MPYTSETDARTPGELYREDGVVCLRGALSAETMVLARSAFDWSVANPGPGAAKLPSKGSGVFYQDLANPNAFAAYAELLAQTDIARAVADLWSDDTVWFMYEQVFEKSQGDTRRTPWHQDLSYLPVRGNHLAVMWISFSTLTREQSLEFVRGSHNTTLYDGSRFDPDDDTAPLYGDSLGDSKAESRMPRLPDIEADRSRWPIVGWPVDPGDVIVFHPGVLHGGGATTAQTPRKTLSLRFFGDDAVVAARPGSNAGSVSPETRAEDADSALPGSEHPLTRMRSLPDGVPFRDPRFPMLRSGSDSRA